MSQVELINEFVNLKEPWVLAISEDTEDTRIIDLYVVPNVCSEYSEQ
jgi:hypothetical protein